MGVAEHVLAVMVVGDKVVGQQRHPVAVAEGVGEVEGDRVREFLVEARQDEIGPCSPEFIDGLVRVAHNRDAGPLTGDVFEQQGAGSRWCPGIRPPG